MGILSASRDGKESLTPVTLNTGTIFDLATGNFVPGKDGNMILNGGLILSNGIGGRPQTFKSSTAISYVTNALTNYPDAEGLVHDTEIVIRDKQRLVDLSGVNDTSLMDRMDLTNAASYGIEEFFTRVQQIVKEKEKHRKDLIRETPFVDIHGKPIRAWVPTIIAIDSWSALMSNKELETYDKVELGDSKANTLAMNEGRLKSDFSRLIPGWAARYGLYFVLTAHIDSKVEMNPYAPTSRDVPMMRSSDKLKRVGSQFKFLTPNMIDTRKTELLQDSKKKCEFPSITASSDIELQKISAVVTRCKNNVSGATFNHVSSQYYGIQKWLDYFLIIKECKSDLLTGTQTLKLATYDTEFTRHNIRELIAKDPLFRRMLEVLGQFVYIRNNWNYPEISGMGYMEFAKKLNASKALKDEILNSTGVWSFNDVKSDKPYMSIIDIVDKLNNKKK